MLASLYFQTGCAKVGNLCWRIL